MCAATGEGSLAEEEGGMKGLITMVNLVYKCTNNQQVYELLSRSKRMLSGADLKLFNAHAARHMRKLERWNGWWLDAMAP